MSVFRRANSFQAGTVGAVLPTSVSDFEAIAKLYKAVFPWSARADFIQAMDVKGRGWWKVHKDVEGRIRAAVLVTRSDGGVAPFADPADVDSRSTREALISLIHDTLGVFAMEGRSELSLVIPVALRSLGDFLAEIGFAGREELFMRKIKLPAVSTLKRAQ